MCLILSFMFELWLSQETYMFIGPASEQVHNAPRCCQLTHCYGLQEMTMGAGNITDNGLLNGNAKRILFFSICKL